MMGQPVMHNKDYILRFLSNFPIFCRTGQNKGAILLGDLEINMTTNLIFLQTLDTLIVAENLIMQIRKNPAQDKMTMIIQIMIMIMASADPAKSIPECPSPFSSSRPSSAAGGG